MLPKQCALCLQIHWFSIINSCVTVLLLTGFLATILMRVLKNDFIKFSRDDEAGQCLPNNHPCCIGMPQKLALQKDLCALDSLPDPFAYPCVVIWLMKHASQCLIAVDEAEETGWKFVHADVFRFPAHPNLFSAVIGSGTQILVMTFVIFGLALVRVLSLSLCMPSTACQSGTVTNSVRVRP